MKHCKPGIQTALLLTGNEILAGDIVDTNSTFIAREFLPAGIRIARKLVIGDDLDVIVDAIRSLAETNDVVIVNGGLGSTVDDLTAEAVSVVTGYPLEENAAAVENIKKRYDRSFSTGNATRFKHLRKQALLPAGVDILPNPVGLAVGFKVKIKRAVFYFTPGVPREMRTMISQSILPDIISNFPVNTSHITKKFKVIGTGESRIQQLIDQHIPKETWDQIDLGFRASMAIVEVKLTIRDESALEKLAETEEKIRSIFTHQIASQGESLQEIIVQLLRSQGLKLSVLESCSAGQITAMINAVAKSKDIFSTGVVYHGEKGLFWANAVELKNHLTSETLPTFAENELLAAQMLEQSDADYVLATSPAEITSAEGYSQPCQKLVISCGSKNALISREFVISREPEDFLIFVSIAALDLLRRFILNYPYDNPYYFDELTRSQLK